VAQAHGHRHPHRDHLLDAQMKTGALLVADLAAGTREHVFEPAAVAVPGHLDLLGAGLGAIVVGEVARDRDIERHLLDQHRAEAQVVGGVHEGVEGLLVDARHQSLHRLAPRDVDLGKDVVAQKMVEQLGMGVALDPQIVRDVVEETLLLLPDQVEQFPRRVDDGDARVFLHPRDRLRHLRAEDAVVVGQVDDVATARLHHDVLDVGGAADVLVVPQVADRQTPGEIAHDPGGRVGRGVVAMTSSYA
jgi:hypothetical protein